jgi:tRNA-dihydrouridine synthase A
MVPYIERELARGEKLSSITRHMLGLVQGLPGARLFRRHLTEQAIRPGAGVEVIFEALRHLRLEAVEAMPQAAE